MIIFTVAYSAFKDKRVVIVPAPAIRGNASGIMEMVSGISSLKKLMPNTISIAMIKITIEPAMANEETSKPMICNSASPKNKKSNINDNDTNVAFSDCICPPALRLKSIINGIEPKISMMAKSTIVTERISLKFS